LHWTTTAAMTLENAGHDGLYLHKRILYKYNRNRNEHQISTMKIDEMGTRLKLAKTTPPGLTLVQSKLLTLKKSIHGFKILTLYLSARAGVFTAQPK